MKKFTVLMALVSLNMSAFAQEADFDNSCANETEVSAGKEKETNSEEASSEVADASDCVCETNE